jgi:hypothetical protein
MFLKVNVENEIWKAIILEPYGKHQGIRLLDSNNQLLESSLIQQKLGVEAQFPLEALVRRRQIKSTSNGQCHRKNVIERASPEKDVESAAQDMTFSPEQMFSNTATVVYFKSSKSATQELLEVYDAPGRSWPLTTHQQQLGYPEQSDVPRNQQVEVVHVNDPSSFYLQLFESCTVLAQLGTNLNTVYSGNSLHITRWLLLYYFLLFKT